MDQYFTAIISFYSLFKPVHSLINTVNFRSRIECSNSIPSPSAKNLSSVYLITSRPLSGWYHRRYRCLACKHPIPTSPPPPHPQAAHNLRSKYPLPRLHLSKGDPDAGGKQFCAVEENGSTMNPRAGRVSGSGAVFSVRLEWDDVILETNWRFKEDQDPILKSVDTPNKSLYKFSFNSVSWITGNSSNFATSFSLSLSFFFGITPKFLERVSVEVLFAPGDMRSFDAGDSSTGGTVRKDLKGLVCCADGGVASGVFIREPMKGGDLGKRYDYGSLEGNEAVYWGVEDVEGDRAGCWGIVGVCGIAGVDIVYLRVGGLRRGGGW